MKETARRFLEDKWAEVLDARECGETDIAKEALHDFLTLSEMYTALFNDDVYGTDKGVKYE